MVSLRRLEPDDLEYLHRWENDPEVWQYGDCGADERGTAVIDGAACDTRSDPSVVGERFSRSSLRRFIENQQHDICLTGQQRLVICVRNTSVPRIEPDTFGAPNTDTPVGFVDLFDFDPLNSSAGVGILICDPSHRGNGYGREALKLAMEYAGRILEIRTLWCTVAADNHASIALFSDAGFASSADLWLSTPANVDPVALIAQTKKLLTFVKSRHPSSPPKLGKMHCVYFWYKDNR